MQKKLKKRRKRRSQLSMIQKQSPAVSLQHPMMMMIIIVTKTMLNDCNIIQTCPNMIAFVEYVVYFLVRNPCKPFHIFTCKNSIVNMFFKFSMHYLGELTCHCITIRKWTRRCQREKRHCILYWLIFREVQSCIYM